MVLREIEGFAYEEIAEILQTNVGTVKSRLMRGRAALREALRERGPLEGSSKEGSPKIALSSQTGEPKNRRARNSITGKEGLVVS